jgi:hypothetical protein
MKRFFLAALILVGAACAYKPTVKVDIPPKLFSDAVTAALYPTPVYHDTCMTSAESASVVIGKVTSADIDSLKVEGERKIQRERDIDHTLNGVFIGSVFGLVLGLLIGL